jgi:Transposase, Mutator family
LPEQAAAAAMVAEARSRGWELTGPKGLLKLFMKNVLETALGEEMTEHLGHEKNCAGASRESTNVRNGTRSKTVISDAVGEVCIDVPRDREGTFAPKIVKKRQRRLTDVDEIVLSLYAKGLTTGEISAHFAEIYGASVSKETISRITEEVVAEMQEWAARPLDAVYVAISRRRHCRQGAGRPGRQPARLRRDRCHRGGPEGCARVVGRHRRGRRQVLDERAGRPEEPGCAGRVFPGVRRG